MAWKRRGFKNIETHPFEQAYAAIDHLETRVVTATVTPNFTPEDVIKWLFPIGVIEKCRAAFPIVKSLYTSNFSEGPLMIPGCNAPCTVSLDLDKLSMCCPEAGYISILPDASIEAALNDIHAVHLSFEKVRRVVNWLGKHATPGAARYYWPTICSLLPTGHAVFAAAGERYKEPSANAADIVELMRETSGIVASALLCNDTTKRDANIFWVSFVPPGERNESGTVLSRNFQMF
jgi:hypothetical protein